jgi:hypothetical protein
MIPIFIMSVKLPEAPGRNAFVTVTGNNMKDIKYHDFAFHFRE